MKEFDDIDRLFQATFDGFEAIPDPSVKENIDKAIAPKKNKRRFFFLIFFFSIVLMSFWALIYPDFLVKNTIAAKNYSSSDANQNEKIVDVPDYFVFQPQQGETKEINSNSLKYPVPSIQNNQGIDKTKSLADKKPVNSISNKLMTTSKIASLNPSDSIRKDEVNQFVIDIIEKDIANQIVTDSIEENNTNFRDVQSIEKPFGGFRKWYFTAFTGWEGTTMRSKENIDINNLSNAGKESARIQSSSFYGKIEINKKISKRFHLLAGVGYKSTTYRQNVTLYSLDSTIHENEITSNLPNPPLYFLKQEDGNQSFQVNTLLIPIGAVFAQQIAEKIHFRLAVGAEFTLGWKKDLVINPTFTSPVFQPFGWNLGIRPEFQYAFKNFRTSVFFNVNQPIKHQINWGLDMRKSSIFGAGLGIQYDL